MTTEAVSGQARLLLYRNFLFKKYLAPTIVSWKFILESYLKKVGGKNLVSM